MVRTHTKALRPGLLAAVSAAVLVVLVPVAAYGITYGEPDDGEHPQVGAVVTEYTDPASGQSVLLSVCTGTLVAADVVLSAAHCFVGLPPGFGTSWFTLDEVVDADRDGVVDPDVELVPGTPVAHPRFGSRAANTYDIAVFLLDDPVAVQPAPVVAPGGLTTRAARQQTYTAVGYGTVRESRRTGWQGILPGWRREKVDQQMLSLTKAWVTFSMNEATGNGGTCYGDSGGPHFSGETVVSITVTGDAMCKATDQTYRLDTPWAQEFLSRYVELG